MKSKLATLTAVMLISGLLSAGHPANNQSREDNSVEVIYIDSGAAGPESFDFDPADGSGPYTGVSDGRIVKWISNERRWADFAVTSINRIRCGGLEMEHICGRPLGLKFDKSKDNLYIADAYFGLLVVGPNGGLPTSLVSEIQGVPLKFSNGLDIDLENGLVYFTDSSQRYTRRDHMLVVLSNDKTGRLLNYNLESKTVTVLLDSLTFPNGVALSKDRSFLLVAETTTCRILRLWLKTLKAGTLEVFADLPGYPDNIKTTETGEYWVAMYSRKRKLLTWIHANPWVVSVLRMLPFDVAKMSAYVAKVGGEGLAVKLGTKGEILRVLEDKNGEVWKFASEVMERDGCLWIGSVENPFVVELKDETKEERKRGEGKWV